MSFEPYAFKPTHQPDEAKPVEFDLKPLDNATFYRLQQSYNRTGNPDWEDCVAVFSRSVVGWRGLEPAFSPKAKVEMLGAEASADFYIWLGQIVGELYTRALLKGNDRKN